MGVAGGAAFPPIQGAIADTRTTRVSMWLAFPAFLYVVGFSAWCWINKGHKFTRAAEQAWLAERAAARAVDYDVPSTAGGAGMVESSSIEDEKKVASNEDAAHIENISYNRV
jgi:FHS family L-fucose permease-like MFS transporter